MEKETKTLTVDEQKKRNWIKCVIGVLGLGTVGALGSIGAAPFLGIGAVYCAAMGASGGVASAMVSMCGKEPTTTKIEIVVKKAAVLSWIPVFVGLSGMYTYTSIYGTTPPPVSHVFMVIWLGGVVIQVVSWAINSLLHK